MVVGLRSLAHGDVQSCAGSLASSPLRIWSASTWISTLCIGLMPGRPAPRTLTHLYQSSRPGKLSASEVRSFPGCCKLLTCRLSTLLLNSQEVFAMLPCSEAFLNSIYSIRQLSMYCLAYEPLQVKGQKGGTQESCCSPQDDAAFLSACGFPRDS